MSGAWEALNQLIEGRDFDPPGRLLSTVKPDAAVRIPPGAPYSIATNVAHADIWQCVWLAQVEGLPSLKPFPDFPSVTASEWPSVRARFLTNLARARELASTDPGVKDEATLLRIAVHGAYHLGQVKLLKRMLMRR